MFEVTSSNIAVYDKIKIVEIVTIIVATISMISSLSVVFILIYQYSKLVKGKTLTHHVLQIAIADTIGNIYNNSNS
jgi:hypothetical protein